MPIKTVYQLIAAFAVSFFAVDFPDWQIPYAKVSLPCTLYGTGLLVVAVLAAAARAFGKARFLPVILAVGGAVPTPIPRESLLILRKTPTSHNLWPFEFIVQRCSECFVRRPGRWLEACPRVSHAIKTPPNQHWSRPQRCCGKKQRHSKK